MHQQTEFSLNFDTQHLILDYNDYTGFQVLSSSADFSIKVQSNNLNRKIII